jgi:hypothetical protein
MEYITHYYRFNDAAEYEAMLPVVEDGELGNPVGAAAPDVVGAIEGAEGYHINIRWLNNVEPAEWVVYRIDDPNSPVRVFAKHFVVPVSEPVQEVVEYVQEEI